MVRCAIFALNSIDEPQYALPGVFVDNFYPNAVNGSLWTLPVEFSMYLILPPMLLLMRRWRRWALVALSVILSVLSLLHIMFAPQAALVIWGTNIFDGLVLVPYFFRGATFVFLISGSISTCRLPRLFLSWLAFSLWGCILRSASLSCCSLCHTSWPLSFPHEAAFGRVFAENDYSYGLYLWAFPIQQAMVMVLGPDAFSSTAIFGTLCLIPSFLLAMVSWHLIEKPASSWGRKIIAWSKKREQVHNGLGAKKERKLR